MVMGGQYVDDLPGAGPQAFCEVFDLDRPDLGWNFLPEHAYANIGSRERQALSRSAFFPAAVVENVVVCRLSLSEGWDADRGEHFTLVLDPKRGEGWAAVELPTPPQDTPEGTPQGTGAAGCEH